jgi:hypothetical protein
LTRRRGLNDDQHALTARAATRSVVAVVAAGVALLAFSATGFAAVFNVTTTHDHTDQTGCTQADCTVREALAAGAAVGGMDTINVPPGTYGLLLGELTLSGDNIIGAGRATVIDGGDGTRVLSTAVSAVAPLTSRITNVTVTHGAATQGGGLNVPSGTLQVLNSQIVGNTATAGAGILVGSSASLAMIGSTVAGNNATGGRQSLGGGIAVASDGVLALGNSTISGNTAHDVVGGAASRGGGIYAPAVGQLSLFNVTIASNEAAEGGGAYLGPGAAGVARAMTNALVTQNVGGACAFLSPMTLATHDNLVQDGSCLLQGAGDVQGIADAKLLGLANYGGPTDTRALAPNSPAINAGTSCFTTTDQRGVPRPNACDIGAFEYVAPKLTVQTTVVNDNGGGAAPSAFSVHVARSSGGDVAGSPMPGSAGTTYTADPGSYVVSSGAVAGYTLSIGGACSPSGAVTLAENQTKTCTVTANDNPASSGKKLPPPQRGKNVNALPASGTVKIKLPGRKTFVVLDQGEQIPLGTTVDVRKGRVTLIASPDEKETADFYGGIFRLGQTKGSKPITVVTLVEKLTACKAKGKATVAKKKTKKRRLWGDGKGNFRTKGKHSAATVVGTKWLVEDRCTSTLTRVVRGRVKVMDFEKDKSVFVRKGHRYIARAQ